VSLNYTILPCLQQHTSHPHSPPHPTAGQHKAEKQQMCCHKQITILSRTRLQSLESYLSAPQNSRSNPAKALVHRPMGMMLPLIGCRPQMGKNVGHRLRGQRPMAALPTKRNLLGPYPHVSAYPPSPLGPLADVGLAQFAVHLVEVGLEFR
jgi:hypothetical protein